MGKNITTKQVALIRSLVAERGVESLPEAQGRAAEYVVEHGEDQQAVDRSMASGIIDELFKAPRRADRRTTPQQWPQVPAGRYALACEDRVRFFQVDRPERGRWAGFVFLSEQASDEFYPVKGQRGQDALAAIADNPQEAMERYGRELGVCGACGRTLTDEESRARGIGPVCSRKF